MSLCVCVTHTHDMTQTTKKQMKGCRQRRHALFVYFNIDVQWEGLFTPVHGRTDV